LSLPDFDPEKPNQAPLGYHEAEVTRNDIFELLSDWEDIFPDMPPFEAARLYLMHDPIEVCITSLMDPYTLFLIEAEQASRDYQALPYDGGLWDQPKVLLDAFTAIRSERSHFDRIRLEKFKNKGTKGEGPKDQRFTSPSESAGIPPRTR
jgi:hypothetical protein